MSNPYSGRFAPTPSGPLHMGSLLTAVASWVEARRENGKWFLRIDDLDAPRNQPGADITIMRQLEGHGLHWDGAPRYQSRHVPDYLDAFSRLHAGGMLYACNCTRRRLATLASAADEPVYDGHCLRIPPTAPPHAWRVRVAAASAATDAIPGDFIVRRADGNIAYQLASVVDEAALDVTHVVRGNDLRESSIRQSYLQKSLNLPRVRYRHLPVLVDARGRKLSKQNHAAAVDPSSVDRNLLCCLHLLGQQPPRQLAGCGAPEVLNWACSHWQEHAIPLTAQLALE